MQLLGLPYTVLPMKVLPRLPYAVLGPRLSMPVLPLVRVTGIEPRSMPPADRQLSLAGGCSTSCRICRGREANERGAWEHEAHGLACAGGQGCVRTATALYLPVWPRPLHA